MDHQDSIDHVRATLEDVSARLLDISMSMLAEALEDGKGSRPSGEKQVTMARRSVERALEALRRISTD